MKKISCGFSFLSHCSLHTHPGEYSVRGKEVQGSLNWPHGGALYSGLRGSSSSPPENLSASLHPVVLMGAGKLMLSKTL